MWNAIVNVMTKMFDALHNMIIALGVPEHAEGISYVLAIVLFTAIIRLLILPLNIKATKSNAKMQEIQPEMQKLQKKYASAADSSHIHYYNRDKSVHPPENPLFRKYH